MLKFLEHRLQDNRRGIYWLPVGVSLLAQKGSLLEIQFFLSGKEYYFLCEIYRIIFTLLLSQFIFAYLEMKNNNFF